MTPMGILGLWLALTVFLMIWQRLPLARAHFVLGVFGSALVVPAISLILMRMAPSTVMLRRAPGLGVDGLANLLLPSLWAITAATILFSALHDYGTWTLPLSAFTGATMTVGMLASDPLFVIAIVEVGTLLTLVGLQTGGDRTSEGVFRVATSLKFMTMMVLAAACLVFGSILASFYAVNQDRIDLPRVIASLLIVGFGITVAAMPFYFHLPDLFDAAPPPVAALFSGPVQCLAFVYLMRTLADGPWLLADEHIVDVLVLGGVASSCMAGLLAFAQPTTARMLAFSSMQEVGWLAFGVGSGTVLGWTGALTFLAVRSVAKPLMLLVLSIASGPGRERTVDKFGGLFKSAPATTIAWCAAGAVTVGVPPAAGFWGVKSMVEAALRFGPLPTILLLASLAAAAGSLARTTATLFFGVRRAPHPMFLEEPRSPALLLAALGVMMVVIGFFPGVFFGPVREVALNLAFLR